MKKWYNPLTWFTPDVRFEPQPIELNPSKLRQKQRAIARLERVEMAMMKGDERPELEQEAKKLRQFIAWVE